jgi:RNA polymerase sigma factor (sigma-70 family)
MTQQQQAFEARVEGTIKSAMPFLMKMSGGDEDLIQEGCIGIWQAMSANPTATDAYFRTKAKFNIINQARGVGKSIDIPKTYPRKVPVTIIHYDEKPDDCDADLSQAILADRRRVPLDEWVIQKMDFRRFLDTLSMTEYGYIHLKMVEGLHDREASKRMDVSVERVQEIKNAIRGKVEDFFST